MKQQYIASLKYRMFIEPNKPKHFKVYPFPVYNRDIHVAKIRFYITKYYN